MEEYHASPGASASFLSDVRREGFSTAALVRNGAKPIQTDGRILCGEVLHSLLQEINHGVHVAPGRVVVRRGAEWEAAKVIAKQAGASGVMLHDDLVRINAALASLWGIGDTQEWRAGAAALGFNGDAFRETPAKLQIRGIVRGDTFDRRPEFSHRWEALPGLFCKVRPDFVVRFRGGKREGQFAQVPIKTTRTALVPSAWWPFWERWHLTSAAFHWAGMRDLFGHDVPQLWIVARLEGSFPWALFNLSNPDAGRGYLRRGRSAQEAIECEWVDRILPALSDLKESQALGYGPEEGGI